MEHTRGARTEATGTGAGGTRQGRTGGPSAHSAMAMPPVAGHRGAVRGGIHPDIRREMSGEAEERIGTWAARQHGVMTRAQLCAAGLTRRMVDRRVSEGRFRRLHRAVYRVGPIAGPREREMAAVLACGAGGRASLRSAGWLWEITPRPDEGSPAEVTVPGPRVVRRPGIRAYRDYTLETADVATVDGVPVTPPARTLIDLAGSLGPRDLERAVARADRRGLVDLEALADEVARVRCRPGIATLAGILAVAGGPAFTRSPLEDRFLEALRRLGLPPPTVNARLGAYEVDCYWPAARLAVELDGRTYHRSWQSQINDRTRDSDLAARGIRVMRITWDQLTRDLDRTMVRVAQALVVRGT
ncbi:MAG TPA: type IV toxin-antitoxin system AbiEi family antitoxin domain-containing protein [Longimicrobiales bacterium]|nr:type IV toxin-antitoxin system AbiEi family antitoxin domain-containing protein [Longimicrobiales bacterium]